MEEVVQKEQLGATLLGGSDIVPENHCEECQEEGNEVEGEGYCVDCQEHLCKTCLAVHRKTKLTRNHKLLDKESLEEAGNLQTSQHKVKDACVDICPLHKAEVVKYYCEDHGVFGCSVCVTIQHRNCGGLGYIPQLAEELENSQEYQTLTRDLSNMKEKLLSTVKEAKSNQSKAGALSEEAMKAVQELKKEVDAAMAALDADLRRMVDEIRANDIETMNLLISKSNLVLKKVETMLNEFDTLRESKKLCQLFLSMKSRKNQIDALRKEFKEVSTHNCDIRIYGFAPQTVFKKAIASNPGIGSLSVVGPTEKANEQSCEILDDPSEMHEATTAGQGPDFVIQASEGMYNITFDDSIVATEEKAKKSPAEITATYVSELNVRTDTDTSTCYISGCLLLPSKELVLADFNNGKIKVISSGYAALKKEYKLTSNPWEIVETGRNRIAATLPQLNKIMFLNLTEPLTIERQLSMNGNCRGLVHHSGNLIVSFSSPAKIEVVDFEGNVLKTLVDERSAASLMSLPYHIAANSNQEIIYVSDCGTNKLIGLTMSGEVNAACGDLNGPRGIHVDANGFVLVCARASQQMYLLTPECRNVKTLLTRNEGLHYPMSICRDDEKQILFVGMDDDSMKLYKIT